MPSGAVARDACLVSDTATSGSRCTTAPSSKVDTTKTEENDQRAQIWGAPWASAPMVYSTSSPQHPAIQGIIVRSHTPVAFVAYQASPGKWWLSL